MENLANINGAFVSLKEAKISIMDYGFLFGYSLFETMRAYNGKIFRLESHLERMSGSVVKLGLAFNSAKLRDAANETVRKNGLREARVKLVITPGEGSLTPDFPSCREPAVLVIVSGYTPYPAEVYARGFKAVISSLQRNSRSPLPGIKSGNQIENLLSRQEARTANFDDAILLNEKGLLAEASSSNIFVIEDTILKTPELGSGILPGVTRGIILELAEKLGMRCLETEIPPELQNAEEAFITNSMVEIMPLVSVDKQVIGSGKPGTFTKKLMTAYRELVVRETG